jgi:hypothetical protein
LGRMDDDRSISRVPTCLECDESTIHSGKCCHPERVGRVFCALRSRRRVPSGRGCTSEIM